MTNHDFELARASASLLKGLSPTVRDLMLRHLVEHFAGALAALGVPLPEVQRRSREYEHAIELAING